MFGETTKFFSKHILKLFLLTLGAIILLTFAFPAIMRKILWPQSKKCNLLRPLRLTL